MFGRALHLLSPQCLRVLANVFFVGIWDRGIERPVECPQLPFQLGQAERRSSRPVPEVDGLRRCIAADADKHCSLGRVTHVCMQRPLSGSIGMIEHGRSCVVERGE